MVPNRIYGPFCAQQQGWPAGVERAERLYKELLDRRTPYSHEPWNLSPFGSGEKPQRVRGPSRPIQGSATCLDLSLLFAGPALSADMVPFIALGNPVTGLLVVAQFEGWRGVEQGQLGSIGRLEDA